MSENMFWTCEQDEILIYFVRNHEILYNVKCKNYRNTQLKQTLWWEISEILNKTDVECNKRWGYIRDYYIRRKSKPGTGCSGEAARRRSQLLSFLDTCSSAKRRILTNSPGTDTSIEDVVKAEDSEDREVLDIHEAIDEESSSNIPSTSQCSTYVSSKNEPLLDEETTSRDSVIKDQNSARHSKKKKSLTHSKQRFHLLKQIAQQLPSTTEDETDLFFSSMAKIVKKLPQYDRAQLRMQIGTLIGNAELQYLTNERQSSNIASFGSALSSVISSDTSEVTSNDPGGF